MNIKELEKTMWATAKKLGGSMDPSEHRHIVLGLVFLKYLIDAFNKQHENLINVEDSSSSLKAADTAKRASQDLFYLPEKAQWAFLQSRAQQSDIGAHIDFTIDTIEKKNKNLRGILPKNYANRGLNNLVLGELVTLIGNIGSRKQGQEKKHLYGHVYEYFLKKFAEAEGKNGGHFYTPQNVGKLVAELLEPHKGNIYDGCCGSGGMFVQSDRFIKEHHSKIGNQSFYGQEVDPATVKLARMNLGIHGIDADLRLGNTFESDYHSGLKADYILAHPPFNTRNLKGARLHSDRNLSHGTQAKGNGNYVWLQHFISKLSRNGMAGIVLPDSSMYSKTGKEGEIRKNLVEDKLVDCMVTLPSQLFYNSDTPACVWVLTRNKTNNKYTNAGNEILFIDAQKLGVMVSPGNRELTSENILLIAKTYHRWRNINGDYTDIKGFCRSVSIEEVRKNGYILTPQRYIGDKRVKKALFALFSIVAFAFFYFFILRNGLLTSKSAGHDTAITVQPVPIKDSTQPKKVSSKTAKKKAEDVSDKVNHVSPKVNEDFGNVSDNSGKVREESAKERDDKVIILNENKSDETKPAPATTSPAEEEKQPAPSLETVPPKEINLPSATSYKVISRAYFYDQPDEDTRRKAFITHWNNSYANIRPVDEKDGFIYVIFINHLNQTSKGWLRKKDLAEVDR